MEVIEDVCQLGIVRFVSSPGERLIGPGLESAKICIVFYNHWCPVESKHIERGGSSGQSLNEYLWQFVGILISQDS